MFRVISVSVVLFLGAIKTVVAQDVEMADQFRSDGKIYVVVGVMLILLIGLFIYMFRIEREVKKMEEK